MCYAFEIKVSFCIKDPGVTFNNSPNCRSHYEVICKKANILCFLIFKSFENRNPVFLISLFNTYFRSILDYYSPVWSPHLLMGISFIERVQRSFSKRIPAIRNLPYLDRLLYLNIRSLQHRKLYFDLVQKYKIVHGFCVVKLNDLGI